MLLGRLLHEAHVHRHAEQAPRQGHALGGQPPLGTSELGYCRRARGHALLSLHWEAPCHLYAAPRQQVGSLRPRPVSLGKGPEQVVLEPRGPQEVLADPAVVLGVCWGSRPSGSFHLPRKARVLRRDGRAARSIWPLQSII